jgi:hypothetical protein
MNRTSRLALLALAPLLLCILPAVAQQQTPAAPLEPPPPKTVTLDLKSVPLDEAINRVVAAAPDISVLIAGTLPKEPRVTLRLTDADPTAALGMLATAGGLLFNDASSQVATPLPRGPGGFPIMHDVVMIWAREEPRGPRPSPPAPEAAAPALTGGAIGVNIAVDLNVKDAPFREAIDEMAKQIPATSHVRLIVDESVPKDLRVTARLSKMPLNWVIDSLVQQAGLTYGVQDEPDPEVVAVWESRYNAGTTDWTSAQQGIATAPRLHTVYIVPKPELHVSGSVGG